MRARLKRLPTLITVCLALAACYSVVWLALWVAVPAVGLDWTPHTITSGSMEPALHVGDVVVTSHHDGVGLAPGTVITYEDPAADGALTTHRVVGVTDDGDYRTRGDANEQADSTTVPPGNVQAVGRIVVPVVGLPVVWQQQGNTLGLVLLAAGLPTALVVAGTAHPAGANREQDELEQDEREQDPRPSHRGASLVTRVGVFGGIVGLLVAGGLVATEAQVSRATLADATANTGNAVHAGFWAIKVAAGGAHSCALKIDGTVWCWGRNDKGQLGDTTTTGSVTPVQVSGLTDATDVAAESKQSCAVTRSAEAWCWGENADGQLGDGTTDDSSSPVQVVDVGGTGTLSDVTDVTTGVSHTCAVKTDDGVVCWGRNDKGQLGDTTTTGSTSPVEVVGVGGTGTLAAHRVDAGEKHTCAVLADTTTACWGENNVDQLGDGTGNDSSSPVHVTDGNGDPFTGADTAGTGYDHTCVTTGTDETWCWGLNSDGQFGDGTTTGSPAPVQMQDGTGSAFIGAVQTTGGVDSTCVRTGSDDVWCTGRNDKGQVGDGTGTDTSTPVQVVDVAGTALGDALDVDAGAKHGCAVQHDQDVWCWGLNSDGQLGDTTTSDSLHAVRVASEVDGIVQTTGGATHSCARKDDDTVWCWGGNASGQLGDGTTTDATTTEQVHGVGGSGTLAADLVRSSVEAMHTCAVLGDATAACWGLNKNGQLGDTTTTDSSSPVAFDDADGTPLTGVADIAPGKEHTCALRDDGTVWCVGRNDKGQLGDNSGNDSTTLVQVTGLGGTGTLSGAVAIASGEKHTCAVLDDTTAACWGQGDKGQLGNAATSDSDFPVQVDDGTGSAFSGADTIGAGKKFTCAATDTAGEVWCWGENNEGQLGDRSGSNSSVPVQVIDGDGSAFTGAVQLTGGEKHTCARTDVSAAWCWGDNADGQLGDGTTTDALSPVQVSGLGGVVDIGVGKDHGCAADADGAAWCWGLNASGQLGDGTTTDSATPVSVME